MNSDQPLLDHFIKWRKGNSPTKDRVKILVDNRESNTKVMVALSKLKVETLFATLTCGDYILSPRIGVERKTVDDFATSIIDKRLFEQASLMKETFEYPIIIVEGFGSPTRRVRSEALMGALSSLLIDYGLPVIWLRNPSETALLLVTLAKREQIGGRGTPRIRGKRKHLTLKDLQEYIVAGLPNVSVTLSRRLLQQFKTVEAIFKASPDELIKIEGIGKKKSRKIKRVLTSEYDAEC
jgi:Fanconi anemia group M protein